MECYLLIRSRDLDPTVSTTVENERTLKKKGNHGNGERFPDNFILEHTKFGPENH